MSTGADYWNQKYGRGEFVYGREANQFLVRYAREFIPPMSEVLSPGEGEGRNAIWLARQGFRVTAVDYSEAALHKLEEYAKSEGVEVDTHCADVLDFDFDIARWDAIVALHVHLEPQRRREFHRRMAAALRLDGVLLLEMLGVDQLEQPSSGPETRDLLYTPDILRRDFHDLDISLLTESARYIEAGEHRGMTSVVSFIATKTGDLVPPSG